MRHQPTPQEIDPLGGITARLIVFVGGAIALVVAIGMSLANASGFSNPLLAVAAIVLLAGVIAFYIRASSPYRAPLSFASHVVICLGALVVVALEALSQWGSNALIRNDWGPIAMAIVVITLGAYRAPLELAACAIGTSTIVGAIAVAIGNSGSLVTAVPPAVFVVTMATPVLAAGIGATVYSITLMRLDREWKESARPLPEPAPFTQDAPTGHLAFLHGTVIPFLDGVVAAGELAPDDGAKARRLAQELRVLMVLDSEQSWLTGIADRFDDPARIAHELDAAQRASLRALITRIQTSDAFAQRSVRVRLGLEEGEGVGVLEADLLSMPMARVQLASFIAVSRSAFPVSQPEFTQKRFSLTFRI